MKKLTKQVEFLLLGAARSIDMNETGKAITNMWLGLGTYAQYKSVLELGLMKFHNNIIPPKRCLGWLILTEKGVDSLVRLLSKKYCEQ